MKPLENTIVKETINILIIMIIGITIARENNAGSSV